jgi:hypothetical protein
MHLPPHPVWFWLILLSPFLTWFILWIVAQNPNVSLKPLRTWLVVAYLLLVAPFLDAGDGTIEGGVSPSGGELRRPEAVREAASPFFR